MNRRILLFPIIAIVLVVAIVLIAPNTKNGNNIESEKPSSGLEDSIFGDEEDSKEDSKEDSEEEQKAEQKPSDNKTETQKPSTQKPSTGNSGNADSNSSTAKMDYKTFADMSPSKQQAYMESFKSLDAFFDWYNDEKAKYEKEHPSIEVGNGAVDLEDVAGKN